MPNVVVSFTMIAEESQTPAVSGNLTAKSIFSFFFNFCDFIVSEITYKQMPILSVTQLIASLLYLDITFMTTAVAVLLLK